jgi:hypothetical protein
MESKRKSAIYKITSGTVSSGNSPCEAAIFINKSPFPSGIK